MTLKYVFGCFLPPSDAMFGLHLLSKGSSLNIGVDLASLDFASEKLADFLWLELIKAANVVDVSQKSSVD